MNIKSLLIGSVSALIAVSGARAADAVVAEPESVDYVRVCDAAGAGYFYIPGGETCLRIGGYVRYQINFANGDKGWKKQTSANLQFSSWSDTELGALTSYIELGASTGTTNSSYSTLAATDVHGGVAGSAFGLNHAWLSLGGLSMGFNGDGQYDGGLDGEGAAGGGASSNFIAYKFATGGVSATLALEEESSNVNYVPNVVAKVSYSAGSIGVDVWAAFDDKDSATFDKSGFSLKGRVSVAVGDAGSLKLLGTYNGGGLTHVVAGAVHYSNQYSNGGRWSLGASYSHKLNDKLALTGVVQYIADTNYEIVGTPSRLNLGAVADYTIVPGFGAKLAVTYSKPTGAKASTGGFLRFQRSF